MKPAVAAQYERTQLQGGELLIVLVGVPGAAAIAPADLAGANVSRAVGVLRLDDARVDPHYVSYFLNSPLGRSRTATLAYGSVQEVINLRDLRRLPVRVPPLFQQRAIVGVLGALDDKIRNCHAVAETADQLWLTRFEHLLRVNDVEDRPLSDFASFVNGRNFTKGASGAGRMVIRIAELSGKPSGSTVYNDVEASDNHIARPGDLLFSWSGSLMVRRWYRTEVVVNQHIFKVIPLDSWPRWFVHGQLLRLLPWFRQEAADKATTMGHIQRRHLDEPVPVPKPATLAEVDRLCAPLWERALAAEREALVLAQLRDALLPALMSGQIRVRNAVEASA